MMHACGCHGRVLETAEVVSLRRGTKQKDVHLPPVGHRLRFRQDQLRSWCPIDSNEPELEKPFADHLKCDRRE